MRGLRFATSHGRGYGLAAHSLSVCLEYEVNRDIRTRFARSDDARYAGRIDGADTLG